VINWSRRSKVTDEASFINDLGADSLDTVELVMKLKKSLILKFLMKMLKRFRRSETLYHIFKVN